MKDLREPRELSQPNQLVMVGAEGFEPPTLCSQSRCATRLRHAPPTISPYPARPPAGDTGSGTRIIRGVRGRVNFTRDICENPRPDKSTEETHARATH